VSERDLSLLDFAAGEYARRGWVMPALHVRIFLWLEQTMPDSVRVLKVFRGAGKSSLTAIYNAFRLYVDPTHQILVQGADDPLAYDLSRDTLSIMEGNPLTTGTVRQVPAVTQWWTKAGFARSARTPQLRARGILSRTTGSRADEIQNDDVETSGNVDSQPMRLKLRRRLGEQAHILKPGGSKLFIGTPHTHDSIYDELITAGATNLVIPLFEHQRRYEDPRSTRFAIGTEPGADGVWCFTGIGAHARLLVEGTDYTVQDGTVHLQAPVAQVLDVCTHNAWPERFTRIELERRRRECRTLNAWDSQYQLQAKPPEQVRLDPAWLKVYDHETQLGETNNAVWMLLGQARIVSATLRLDPASGKPKSDVSALCLVLQDAIGNMYWHRAIALYGELAEVSDRGEITGGQVEKICDVVREFELTRIEVETNGIGGHVPSILRGAIKRRGLPCAVREVTASSNKNRRILSALEPPLRSGVLWAHRSVMAVIEHQMRDWNPAVTDQPDDYLDCLAGAITAEPVRIGKRVTTREERKAMGWQTGAGVHDIELDLSGGTMNGGRNDRPLQVVGQ
jgi:hypothetical protein